MDKDGEHPAIWVSSLETPKAKPLPLITRARWSGTRSVRAICTPSWVHRGFSNQVAVQFPDEYFDFVYIDSDHRYATVKEDLELYSKKLKVRRLLCGDDYGQCGCWECRVDRAVDKFLSKNTVMMRSLQHSNSSWRKRKSGAGK
jgi:hypothetical protein